MTETNPISCEKNHQNMHICRTCLSAEYLMDLFAGPDVKSREEQLATITGVKISPNDGLPQKICNTCSNVIDSAFELRQTSAHTEKILIQNGFQYNEQKLLMKNESDDLKIKEEDYNNENNCLCGENVVKSKVKRELNSVTDLPKLSSSTKKARNVKKVRVKRKTKLNKTITGTSASNVDKTDGRKRKSFTDDVKQEDEPIKHLKTDDAQTRSKSTDETGKKTKKLPGLRQRVKKLKTFWSLAVGPVERNERVQCKICDKLVKYHNFTGHAATHFEPEFTCEVCGLKLMSKKNLADHHQRKHGATKNFACAQCDYQCVCRADLQNHIRRVHTGERPFICDLCSETFYQRRCLAAHMKCHYAVRKYQCDRCSKMFKSQGQLTAHYNRFHIMRYTFYCDHCSYKASGSSKVRDHLTKVHSISRDKQTTPIRFLKERREESRYAETDNKNIEHLMQLENVAKA